MQYVSVQQQVQGAPHPRELSNIVTVSRPSCCKVTHLHRCDGTPQSLDLLSLFVSHICVTENVGADSFPLLEAEGKQEKEGEGVKICMQE